MAISTSKLKEKQQKAKEKQKERFDALEIKVDKLLEEKMENSTYFFPFKAKISFYDIEYHELKEFLKRYEAVGWHTNIIESTQKNSFWPNKLDWPDWNDFPNHGWTYFKKTTTTHKPTSEFVVEFMVYKIIINTGE